MAENSTVESILTPNIPYGVIWIYLIWGSYFIIVSVPNVVVVLTIMRYSALRNRNEYLMMSGLSFADTASYAATGFHRLFLIITNQWTAKRSLWSCVTLVHNVVWKFAMPASGLMLVVISLDRFIAVAVPIKYRSLTTKYSYRMLGLVYSFSILMCLVWLILGFVQRNEQVGEFTAPCFAGSLVLAVDKYYAAIFMPFHSISATLSVVIYFGVGFVYWKKKQQQIGVGYDQPTVVRERNRQIRVTKNLAISCLCTTVFIVIPNIIGWTGKLSKLPHWLVQCFWLMPPLNPFCNIVIYYKRQPDLKKGMRALIINKIMPPNLDLWTAAVPKRVTPPIPKVDDHQAVDHV